MGEAKEEEDAGGEDDIEICPSILPPQQEELERKILAYFFVSYIHEVLLYYYTVHNLYWRLTLSQ